MYLWLLTVAAVNRKESNNMTILSLLFNEITLMSSIPHGLLPLVYDLVWCKRCPFVFPLFQCATHLCVIAQVECRFVPWMLVIFFSVVLMRIRPLPSLSIFHRVCMNVVWGRFLLGSKCSERPVARLVFLYGFCCQIVPSFSHYLFS